MTTQTTTRREARMLRHALPMLITLTVTALVATGCDDGPTGTDGSITPVTDIVGVDAGGDSTGSDVPATDSGTDSGTDTPTDGPTDTVPGTCTANDQCANGQYCAAAGCGVAGTCQPLVFDCAAVIQPVCGCDGVTYQNACLAAAAATNVASQGACGGVATCAADNECTPTQYCSKATCDALLGTCETKELACDAVFAPVCGCDGVTYDSDCSASGAGQNVNYTGACGVACDPFTCPSDQQAYDTDKDGCPDVCLCYDGTQPTSAGCPTPDPKALLCTETGGTWDPGACGDYVCGVPNGCKAAIPGCDCGPNANFEKDLGCVADASCSAGNSCGGLTGIACGANEFCEQGAGQCNVSDGIGACVAVPDACTFEEAPVCGCDGVTYSNDCFRQAAEVQKSADGACDTDCTPFSCEPGMVAYDSDEDGCFDACNCADGTPPGPTGCASNDEKELCENSDGVWDPYACMHYNCGSPNLCLALIPGCNCGPDANFVDGQGCVPDPQCQVDDSQQQCESTGGTWDPSACGDYDCGTPNDCEALIPGCNCGPDANFVDGQGCVPDPQCQGSSSNQQQCESTGGTWDPSACGDYDCGKPNDCDALIPGCDCGPEENFVPGEGCQPDLTCAGGTLFCGGLAGIECPGGQFCEYQTCGNFDQFGVCQLAPTGCDDNYDPVCGCDGKTYSNDCERQTAGVSLDYTGVCEGPTP